MSEEKPNKRKRRKRFVILLIVVLFLLILPFQVYRLRNRLEFNRRVQTLAAEGYPVSLNDLESAYVLPEGVDNAADVYQKAFEAYVEPNEAEEEWLPIRGFYEPSEDEPPYPPEVMEAIKTSLSTNRECLELLDKAAQMEHCLLPRPRDGIGLNCWWYVDPLKKVAKLLCERNIFLAQSGKTDDLYKSLNICFGLTEISSLQPLMIDQLLISAIKGMIVGNLEESLNLTTFSDVQLEILQQKFQFMWENNNSAIRLINERAGHIEVINSPESDILEYIRRSNIPIKILFTMNRLAGLKSKDSIIILDFYNKWIEIEKLPFYERPLKLDELREEFYSHDPIFHFLLTTIPAIRTSDINLRIVSQLQCAETALAVERYRLKYQRLPESLEALVPEFIDTVYLDPFDGKPLRYRLRDEGGYTIYCIGEDGIDNGGLNQEQMHDQSEDDTADEWDYPFTVRK